MALPTHGATSGGGSQVYDPASDGLFGEEDPTDETVMKEASLDVWDYRIGTGTKVVTRDNHRIGMLHTVEIDAEGKSRGIVVASGLLHHGHRAIDIAQVHSANAEQIVRTITKDAFEEMAE